MPKFERVKDKWSELRKDLYGNVEPEVTLESITMPCYEFDGHYNVDTGEDEDHINWKLVEELPAIAASTSYGSKEKIENDSKRAILLNKKLISQGHHVPLEIIQLGFHVSGISKACGAQMSRHRLQGHVSASRRFKEAMPQFIYPVLEYIEDELEAKSMLENIEAIYDDTFAVYSRCRDVNNSSGYKHVMKKENARLVLPISYATERTWWVNVRALRDFFRLRLAADAEWEIRRLAWMIYDMVCPLMPSLFSDITDS